MMNYILGIDTSAYTTSIALTDFDNQKTIVDKRKVLSVPSGQKGLRQQDAVFQHLRNFQELYSEIQDELKHIKIVSVSSRPRNVEGSYMPVFTVGQNYGKVIAKTLNCDYFEYSHQENHIAASLIDHYKEISDDILAIHISGGTTEFLKVKKGHKGYDANIVGGSKDITLGQLIDRIGTLMGFSFPCGVHMERYLELEPSIDPIKLPAISGESYINLSGMENYYSNLYLSNKYRKESIIYSLFNYVAECILHIIRNISHDHNFKNIIIAGGVASNSVIRDYILNNLTNNYKVILASKENSSDNAVGVSMLPIMDRWYNEIKTY
jgi:N6-L-threonylcarbamoyladenine synthase